MCVDSVNTSFDALVDTGTRVRKASISFLKKKKQKNFSPLGPVGRRRGDLCVDTCKWRKVFLVLFFQGLFGIVHRELMKAAAR
jgi:hypothetical protein